MVNVSAAADGVLRADLSRRLVEAAQLIQQANAQKKARVGVLPGERPSIVIGTATQAGYPSPVSSARCPAGPVKDEIDAVFGTAGPWAESVAWRESNCRPDARNGSSGSAGVFQLLGHQDLLRAACPTLDPNVSWSSADCNIRAAKMLYDAAGIAPWRL